MSTNLPDYYHILGLSCFEEDTDLIQTTVRQRTSYIRRTFSEEQPEACDTLLKQMEDALEVLLDSDRKARYDADLRSNQSQRELSHRSTKKGKSNKQTDTAEDLSVIVSGSQKSRRMSRRARARENHTGRLLFMIFFGGLVGIAAGVAILWHVYDRDPLGVVAWLQGPNEEQSSSESAPPLLVDNDPDTATRNEITPHGPVPKDAAKQSETSIKPDPDLPKEIVEEPPDVQTEDDPGKKSRLPELGGPVLPRSQNISALDTGENHLKMLAETAAGNGDLVTAFRLLDELSEREQFDSDSFQARLLGIAEKKAKALRRSTDDDSTRPRQLPPLKPHRQPPDNTKSTVQIDPVLVDFDRRNYTHSIEGASLFNLDDLYVEVLKLDSNEVAWSLEPTDGVAGYSEEVKIQLSDWRGAEIRVKLSGSPEKPQIYIAAYYQLNDRWSPLTIQQVSETRSRLELSFAQNKSRLAASRSSLSSLSSEYSSLSSSSPRSPLEAKDIDVKLALLRNQIKKQRNAIGRFESSLPLTEITGKQLAALAEVGNRLHKKAHIHFRVSAKSADGTISLVTTEEM